MNTHFFCHATMIVSFGGVAILVDPMLAAAQTTDPIANSPNPQRNPLVELPFDEPTLSKLLETIDEIIVTHLHSDHWDADARGILPNTLPIFCQPADQQRIEEAGFLNVIPIGGSASWHGLRLSRTGGQHGRGEIGQLMAPESGFVLETPGEPVTYLAGDTIWCREVEGALASYQPDVIIVNAGAAQFTTGGPITMAAEDITEVSRAAPDAAIVAVHMEAINHCPMRRSDLKKAIAEAGIGTGVHIPDDGQQFALS